MRLFLKLVVVMVALGGVGLALLALRQQRYETSSELSRTHWRILQQEQAIWRLRAEVARQAQPQQLRQVVQQLNLELDPITHRTSQTAASQAE